MSTSAEAQFTRISDSRIPAVELSTDAVAQVTADHLNIDLLLQNVTRAHTNFMQHRKPDETFFTQAIDTSGRPLILTISADLVQAFTANDMDSCPECCEHCSTPHAPSCSYDLDA